MQFYFFKCLYQFQCLFHFSFEKIQNSLLKLNLMPILFNNDLLFKPTFQFRNDNLQMPSNKKPIAYYLSLVAYNIL